MRNDDQSDSQIADEESMAIPFDPRLTKLRILIERAERVFRQREAEYKRIMEEAERTARAPVDEAQKQMWALMDERMQIAHEMGYCGRCDKPLSECQCVAFAINTAACACVGFWRELDNGDTQVMYVECDGPNEVTPPAGAGWKLIEAPFWRTESRPPD
jgi:hypothetical protein